MKHLAGRALTLLAVLALVGLLPWLTTTDPALTILHARYSDRQPTPEVLDAIRAETGLDGGPAHVLGGWAAGCSTATWAPPGSPGSRSARTSRPRSPPRCR
ncbi:hypothetical protein ACFQVA_22955 [Actinomadura keratinilytica]